MATLKVKKIKGHEYFYWSKSVRSRKRYGGTGKVMTVDFLIGATPTGQWLPYRLWAGEAQLQEYAEAVVKHLCPPEWAAFVEVGIDWQRYKVSIKSNLLKFTDCRSRRWRKQREALQSWLDRIIGDSTQINEFIHHTGYALGEYYRCSKVVEEMRQVACEARRHPDNFVSNAEDILDESAHANQRRADQAMEHYLQHIESLEKFAPPSKRLEFRHQVINKAERLAQDPRWLERYKDALVRP